MQRRPWRLPSSPSPRRVPARPPNPLLTGPASHRRRAPRRRPRARRSHPPCHGHSRISSRTVLPLVRNTGRSYPVPCRGRVAGLPVRGGWRFAHRRRQCAVRVLPGLEQGHTRRFGFFGDRSQPCATIIQGEGFDSPHTLDYGQSVTAALSPGRTVTCASAVDGLTCTLADGTGSRASISRSTRSPSSDTAILGDPTIKGDPRPSCSR